MPTRRVAEETDIKQLKMLEVLGQFRLLFNSVRRHYREVQNLTGMGGAQLWALAYIGEHPGVAVGEVARALSIHQSTASNLIRDLETAALISKTRLGGDQRSVRLHTTAKGRQVLKKAPRPLIGVLQDALMHLPTSDLDLLHLQLGGLIELMTSHDKRARRTPLSQL